MGILRFASVAFCFLSKAKRHGDEHAACVASLFADASTSRPVAPGAALPASNHYQCGIRIDRKKCNCATVLLLGCSQTAELAALTYAELAAAKDLNKLT
jgi:hypothetical protein